MNSFNVFIVRLGKSVIDFNRTQEELRRDRIVFRVQLATRVQRPGGTNCCSSVIRKYLPCKLSSKGLLR